MVRCETSKILQILFYFILILWLLTGLVKGLCVYVCVRVLLLSTVWNKSVSRTECMQRPSSSPGCVFSTAEDGKKYHRKGEGIGYMLFSNCTAPVYPTNFLRVLRSFIDRLTPHTHHHSFLLQTQSGTGVVQHTLFKVNESWWTSKQINAKLLVLEWCAYIARERESELCYYC